MPQSLSLFDAAMKDTYGPGLKNTLNKSHPLLTEIEQKPEGYGTVGRQVIWALQNGRSTSTGSRAELAALPSADRQRFVQAKDNLAYHYHTIKVSGQARLLSMGSESAFVPALEAEIQGAAENVTFDFARQIQNGVTTISATNYTGSMGTLTAASTTLLTMSGNSKGQMRPFFKNERIDVINSADGTVRGTGTIASVDLTAKTITTTVAIAGATTGDFVCRQGAWGQELTGLAAWISATTVMGGLDPTTTDGWAAITSGSSTTGISDVALDEAAETVETDGDGEAPELWVSSHTQRRKLAQQYQAQKRYDGKEMTLTTGWKGLQISQGTLIADRFQKETTVYGIDTADLAWFSGHDWSWDDSGGSVLYKALDGSDAVEARYLAYKQLVATKRNSMVNLTLKAPTF